MTEMESWEKTCPLCGGNNQCAMASEADLATCWCRDVRISPEVLGAIPDEARNRVCVCPSCAARQGEADAR